MRKKFLCGVVLGCALLAAGCGSKPAESQEPELREETGNLTEKAEEEIPEEMPVPEETSVPEEVTEVPETVTVVSKEARVEA